MPPSSFVSAGVCVGRCTIRDGRKAKKFARVENQKIDDFKKGKTVGDNVRPDCTFHELSASYLKTEGFKSLSYSTQEKYDGVLHRINMVVGYQKVTSFTPIDCERLYGKWVKSYGRSNANYYKTIFSVLMTYAMSIDLIQRNPFRYVKTAKTETRSVVWKKEEVDLFLDHAFGDTFEYRSVGMIVYLCYEFGQRPGDIMKLQWDAVDFEELTVTIKQQKRGATVFLPIDKEMEVLLRNQHKTFSYQPYVAPRLYKGVSHGYYNSSSLSRDFRKIAAECGLNPELQVRDLRKSAIMEMVEEGVDATGIMTVTGHANIKSLNPYMKNSRKAAAAALSKRKK